MMTWRVWLERGVLLLGGGLRLLAVGCAAALALFCVAAFLVWDVDPWEARKRYERWREAWFSGKGNTTSASAIGTRFVSREIDGVSWHTGISGRGGLEFKHCYARLEGANGQPDQVVQVAQGGGIAGAPLVIWNNITDQQAAIFAMQPVAFVAAAKRGCAFEGGEDDQS